MSECNLATIMGQSTDEVTRQFFLNEIPPEKRNSGGIYKIENLVNGKVYVGKTVNFRKRYVSYKSSYLNKTPRQINAYFRNAIDKTKPENFSFSVLEFCDVDIMAERELFWMVELSSTDSEKGYNLRMDSSTGMITHDSTREKISNRLKKEYSDGTRSAEEMGVFFSKMWEDEELKDQMRQQVSESRRSFFIQSTKDGKVVAVWNGINQVMNHNKDYKWQNIYAACNGNKKNYRSFLWKRVDELEEWMLGYLVTDNTDLAGRSADESVYQTGEYHRGGLWVYEVSDGENTEEMAGKDLRILLPNIYGVFYRLKTDTVKHKGYTITRRKFGENTAVQTQ